MNLRRPFSDRDPISVALHSLRLDGMFTCRSELSSPYAYTMPHFEDALWFHILVEGEGTLFFSDGEAHVLEPARLVLLPFPEGHILGTDPDRHAPDVRGVPQTYLNSRYSLLSDVDGDERTVLVCGLAKLAPFTAGELLRQLPRVLMVDAGVTERYLPLLVDEAMSLQPGGETIITRLADILVVQAVRAWLRDEGSQVTGWLAVLKDPSLGRAMGEVLRSPGDDWTVASMARVAGMSRSVFAERFSVVAEETPMQSVTRIRMAMACEDMLEGRDHVGEIAERYGYRSEAAFRRAFVRVQGVTPGQVRKRACEVSPQWSH